MKEGFNLNNYNTNPKKEKRQSENFMKYNT